MRTRRGLWSGAVEMRSWREFKGLTQAEAASYLFVSPNSWARWERGTVFPDPAWRARILALVRGRSVELPDVLRDYRQAHAVRQWEAASRMGVSRRTWQRWEAGQLPGKQGAGRIWRFIDAEMRLFR